MNQHGLLSGLTLYAVIGAGALAAVAGIGWKVQSARLEAAQARIQALETEYQSCLASVEKQNWAVADLESASKAAQDRAKRAVAASEATKRRADVEIGRLKAAKPSGSVCAAQQAVEQVRKGLK